MSHSIEVCRVAHYMAVDKIKLHPDNPRTIRSERLEQLKDSIRSKGFYQPILVWKKNGIVLAGNHRLIATRELIEEGHEFVNHKGDKNVLPIVLEDCDDTTARAILFETNNTYADWIEDRLREALKDAEESGESVAAWGFSSEDVDKMLTSAISDGEEITERDAKDRSIDPVDEEKLRKAVSEDDEYEPLTLPKPVYEQMVALLSEIAPILNPEWTEGNSLGEAAQALVQAARSLEIVERIEAMHEGSPPKKKRKKREG